MGVAIITPDVNFADANLGKVTLTDNVPVRALSIVAPESIFGSAYQLSLSYYPINTSQRGVTWRVESGGDYASVNSAGLLSIKSSAKNSSVTVKVVSSFDTSISATKTFSVTYTGQDPIYVLKNQFDNATLFVGIGEFEKKLRAISQRAIIFTDKNLVSNQIMMPKDTVQQPTIDFANYSLINMIGSKFSFRFTNNSYQIAVRFCLNDFVFENPLSDSWLNANNTYELIVPSGMAGKDVYVVLVVKNISNTDIPSNLTLANLGITIS